MTWLDGANPKQMRTAVLDPAGIAVRQLSVRTGYASVGSELLNSIGLI
jgi:hypothetical protein